MNKHKICPACNYKKNEFFFESVNKDFSIKKFNYLKCKNCNSVFLSKKNYSNEKLEKFHIDNWHKKDVFKYEKNDSKTKNINRWYHTYKNFKLNRKLSVLDVGCGNGSFLIAFKKMKFKKLYGFDADPKIINNIKEDNIKTFVSNFNNFFLHKEISKLKFDYIFLHDVLEHSYNPSKLLQNIKKVIKKNSQIFIKIPSGECLQLEMLKEYNCDTMAPFHRTLFSKKGISLLLKKRGFKKVNFFVSNKKNWGWTRGISSKLKYEKFYEKLRKNKKFKKFDFEIDDLFEKISIKINKEPIIFLRCSQN